MSNNLTAYGLTDEQQRAVGDHDANLVVVAGAGSGKTRVLVERYLSFLERHDWTVDSLVAITFTEKAAREMRDRVRYAVERKAEEALQSDDVDLARRWNDHRASLDAARISTIHSLCAALLRRYPAEAAIDPGFEVLEEIDATLLREKSIADALADLEEQGGEELDLFSHYESDRIVATLKRLMESGSAAVDAWDKVAGSVDMTWQRWIEWQQVLRQRALEKLWRDPGWLASVDWAANTLAYNANDKLEGVRATVASYFGAASAPDLAGAHQALSSIKAAIKLNVGSKHAWGGESGLKEAKNWLRSLRSRAAIALEEMGPELGQSDELAAKLLPLWRRLHRRALTRYQTQKDQLAVVDFDDLEQRTRSLLLGHQEVAEQCQREIGQLLVDEFQDTSPVQRDIIYCLAPPDNTGRLFVVGDPKQSIYSFRGADISLFRQVQGDLRHRGGRELPLSQSFRTHSSLVGSFNAVFHEIMRADPDSPFEVDPGPDLTAFRPSLPGQDVALEVLLVPRQAATPSTEVDAAASGDQQTSINAEESRRWQAYWIARRLQEMVEGGYQVWDKAEKHYRAMRYDDVAMLFRSSSSFLPFEDVFRSVGLRYITVAGKGYFKRQEVWDLVMLLKALHNPFDDLSLAGVLRSPMFGLSDEALFVLRQRQDPERQGQRIPLAQALEQPDGVPETQREAVAFAREVIGRLRILAGRSSLLEVLQTALRETAYLATISSLEGGKRRRGNVEKLLVLVRKTKSVSLSDFTSRLEKLRDQEARESESLVETDGAVQLMTVHAAKGLEFPVVVIGDASGAGRPKPPSEMLLAHPVLGYVCTVPDEATGKRADTANWLWGKTSQLAAEVAEEKRVLYVAATRAQDYLIMAGQVPSASRSNEDRSAADDSWLERYLGALGIDPWSGSVGEEDDREYEWGRARVRWVMPPQVSSLDEDGDGVSEVALETALDENAFAMALPVPVDALAALRDVTATSLAEAGAGAVASLEQLAENLRLRDRVVQTVASERCQPYVSGARVGQIAHRALQQWRLPSRAPRLMEILRSFAWNEGLTNSAGMNMAASLAYDYLVRFERSDLCKELRQAEGSRRHEVPFVLRRNGRTAHGNIDAIFRRPGGRWVVVDFKTDWVEGGAKTLSSGIDEKYLLQIGIYALAVEESVGETPVVLLHYIRHGRTVLVPETAWRGRLETLGW